MSDLPLLMISAMYENGGNTTHRFLDGHPQMFVYPFESQLGTKLVSDPLSQTFPIKYRWPSFSLTGTPEGDYGAIIDEECKVRARTPNVSKFRDADFHFSDDDRREHYVGYIKEEGRSRSNNVSAFFRATFDAWKNVVRSGRETMYVGYSPIVVVDADKILLDFPNAHVIHVVRNPWSGYADTKRRAVPLPLAQYMLGWMLSQYHAVLFRELYPERLHIIRIEDVLENPAASLGTLCKEIGAEESDTLATPSWNGRELDEVYPWGTIRRATADANRETALELSEREREDVARRAGNYLQVFNYADFL